MESVVKNERSIIDASGVILESGMQPYRIVLRHNDPSVLHPYVTHFESLRLEGGYLIHDAYFWGHYHAKLEEAVEDFKERRREKGI
jgi:hypothetical protein